MSLIRTGGIPKQAGGSGGPWTRLGTVISPTVASDTVRVGGGTAATPGVAIGGADQGWLGDTGGLGYSFGGAERARFRRLGELGLSDGDTTSDMTKARALHRLGEKGTGLSFVTGGLRYYQVSGAATYEVCTARIGSLQGRFTVGPESVTHTTDSLLKLSVDSGISYALMSTRVTGREAKYGCDSAGALFGAVSAHDAYLVTDNTIRLGITSSGQMRFFAGGSAAAPQMTMPSDSTTGRYDLAVGALAYSLGGLAGYSVDTTNAGATAASDTAGQNIFFRTTNAGASTSAPRQGGNFTLRAGNGGASAVGGVNAGDGATYETAAGSGGAGTSGSSYGGGGANHISRSGGGGASNSTTTHSGGDAGTIQDLGGSGGGQTGAAASARAGHGGGYVSSPGPGGSATGAGSTGNGGNGGSHTINLPSGGTSVGGMSGLRGKHEISGGVMSYTQEIAITPSATHALILRQTAAANQTSVTSAMLGINTDAANRHLLLPPEADATGVYGLIIRNASAVNTLLVYEDGDATLIATLLAGQAGTFACNGTKWFATSVI